jgi:hypothetical protein
VTLAVVAWESTDVPMERSGTRGLRAQRVPQRVSVGPDEYTLGENENSLLHWKCGVSGFPRLASAGRGGHGSSSTSVTWLILPVVICLSQRLSHACLSMNQFIR